MSKINSLNDLKSNINNQMISKIYLWSGLPPKYFADKREEQSKQKVKKYIGEDIDFAVYLITKFLQDKSINKTLRSEYAREMIDNYKEEANGN